MFQRKPIYSPIKNKPDRLLEMFAASHKNKLVIFYLSAKL